MENRPSFGLSNDSAVEVSFITRFSKSKAPMSTLINYSRMLGVCVTLSCIIYCYVYQAGLDVERGLITDTYAIVL